MLDRAASNFRFQRVDCLLRCFSVETLTTSFAEVSLVDGLVEHWAGSKCPVLSAELVLVDYCRSICPGWIAELEGGRVHCFVSR